MPRNSSCGGNRRRKRPSACFFFLYPGLTFLGIDNANTDKKERLITDEVESNNELIYFYLNCFYKTRKKACDEINKKFFNGEEKIKIKVNKNINELLKLTEKELLEPDDEDGGEDE